MLNKKPKIFLALPIMNEAENLPELIKCIEQQNYQGYIKLFVCINQPDSWWDDEEKIKICKNNKNSAEILQNECQFPLKIIDRFSKGKGWSGKKYGVGWARKTIMDEINSLADPDDIIISLDADTTFRKEYFSSIAESFSKQPDKIGMAVPYYHKLTDDNILNRAILHYEIYMRYYALNLWRIDNPYSFTALGSAITLPVWGYRKIGGISPHKSGEDFYFLQKLKKTGDLILWNNQKVFPATRYSDRVFFGTGPALIKGRKNDWSSYPIYHYSNFDIIKELYENFDDLYLKNIDSPIIKFMESKFNTAELWQPLRENYKSKAKFVKACKDKIDGLRILQYLKSSHEHDENTDEKNLIDFLERFYSKESDELGINLKTFSFQNSSILEMDRLRNFLVLKEEECQVIS